MPQNSIRKCIIIIINISINVNKEAEAPVVQPSEMELEGELSISTSVLEFVTTILFYTKEAPSKALTLAFFSFTFPSLCCQRSVCQGSFRTHQTSWKIFRLGMPQDHAISNLVPQSHSSLKPHPRASQELSYGGRKPLVSHLNICNTEQLFQEPKICPIRFRPSLGNRRSPHWFIKLKTSF